MSTNRDQTGRIRGGQSPPHREIYLLIPGSEAASRRPKHSFRANYDSKLEGMKVTKSRDASI